MTGWTSGLRSESFCVARALLSASDHDRTLEEGLPAECVADRDAVAHGMTRTEGCWQVLGAMEKVKPSLRPHKKVSHRVEAQPAAEASHEMTHADVICAPDEATSFLPRIEASAQRANA